jgi:hypothetical protein
MKNKSTWSPRSARFNRSRCDFGLRGWKRLVSTSYVVGTRKTTRRCASTRQKRSPHASCFVPVPPGVFPQTVSCLACLSPLFSLGLLSRLGERLRRRLGATSSIAESPMTSDTCDCDFSYKYRQCTQYLYPRAKR